MIRINLLKMSNHFITQNWFHNWFKAVHCMHIFRFFCSYNSSCLDHASGKKIIFRVGKKWKKKKKLFLSDCLPCVLGRYGVVCRWTSTNVICQSLPPYIPCSVPTWHNFLPISANSMTWHGFLLSRCISTLNQEIGQIF